MLQQAWKLFDQKKYAEAQNELASIFKEDEAAILPSRGSAWYLLGKIQEANNHRQKAFHTWKEGLDTLDAHRVFDPYLGYAFVRSAASQDQQLYFDRLTEVFYRVLIESNARDQHDLLNKIFRQSDFLLGKEAVKKFEARLSSRKTDEHPGKALREYWRRQDPTPATLVNERLIEHLKRVEYARIHYACKTVRGFDDRGMIYVRLGPPNHQGTAIRGVHSRLLPHYIWAYDYISRGLYFPFVDFGKGKGFQLVSTIERAIPRMIDIQSRIAFYLELGKVTPILYRRWDETQNILRDAATEQAAKVKVQEELYYLDQEDLEYRKKVTPKKFTRVLGNVEEFRLAMRTARFMEPDSSTRFEIYLAILRKQLKPKWIKKFMEGDTLYLNLAVALENKSYWPDTTYQFPLDRLTNLTHLQQDTLLYQAQIHVPNKLFYVSGEVEAWLTGNERKFMPTSNLTLRTAWRKNAPNPGILIKMGGFRSPPELALRLHKKPLTISDLELSTWIEPDMKGGNPQKNNLRIKPFPFNSVSQLHPIYLYFEIYGLKISREDNRSHYKIAYQVKVIKPRKKIVSRITSIFQSKSQKRVELESEYSSTSATSKETIALDLKGLIPGRVVLTVIVTDLLSNTIARRSAQFELVP